MKNSTWKRNLKAMINSTHIDKYVVDTMAIVLQMEQRKLSQSVMKIFEAVERVVTG